MERLRRKVRERPALSVATMGFLLAGSIHVSMTRPLQIQVEGLESALDRSRSRLKQIDSAEVRLAGIKEEVDEHRKLLLAEGGLPEEGPARSRAIHHIVQLALQRDLRPTRVSPATPVVEEPLTHWPVELVVEGGFHALGRFFQEIARMDEIVNVRKLSVSARRDPARPETTLAASITLTLFQFSLQDPDPNRDPELESTP